MKCVSFLFGFTCLLTSCTILDYQVTTYTADLRPFSRDGFFISPALSIAETYEPVSLLEISFRAGYQNGEYFVPSYDEMLDKLAAEAKAHGANALLNCNIKADISYSKYETSLNGYTASGYAVKITGRPVAPVELVTDKEYDLQKALRLSIDFNCPLIAKKGNKTEYLDPSTESYLDETSFTRKYGQAILFQLQEFSAKRFASDESPSRELKATCK